MVKIKELYQKYVNYIVILLIAIIGLKSCQGCSRNSKLKFADQKYEQLQDSTSLIINNQNKTIDSLESELNLYKYKASSLQETNNALKESNSNLSKSNKNLSESNKKLIKKD